MARPRYEGRKNKHKDGSEVPHHFTCRLFLLPGSQEKKMAGITLAQAEAKLTTWMAADDAVANGQAYTIDGRTLTRANADEISRKIIFWDKQCKRLSRGGLRVKGGTPA